MVVSTDPQREQVLKLIEEKEKIERKISDLGLVLATVSSSSFSISPELFIFCRRTKLDFTISWSTPKASLGLTLT